MIPKALLEHAISVKLKEYDDIEIILLKGHLILEQMLHQLLVAYKLDATQLDKMGLMFKTTLELVVAIQPTICKELYDQLKEVNRIRNKAAHELFFDHYHADLKKWASSVLGFCPKTIDSRRTYKNHVIRAFSYLAGFLQGYAEAIADINNSNKRAHGTR